MRFSINPDEFQNPAARDITCLSIRQLFYSLRDKYKDVFKINEIKYVNNSSNTRCFAAVDYIN